MKSIRTKVVLISCIICIFSILSSTIIGYKILSENLKEQTLEKLDEISQKHAAEIEGWLGTQVRLLDDVYDEIIYKKDFHRGNLIDYFNYKNERNPDIKEYYIAFPENVFVRGIGLWFPDGDYEAVEREWYINAVESEGIEISSTYVDANHGELIITLSKAIRIDGEVIGVLCSDIAIEHIVNIINKSRPTGEEYGFLVDNNGNILAHPNKEFLFSKEKGLINIKEIYSDDIFVKYIGEKELITIVDYDGVEKFVLYTNLGSTGLHIGLATSIEKVMKPLDRIIDSTVILAITLTVLSVILTFIFGNSISKPIKEATNYIEQMAQLDITHDTNEKYLEIEDEIGRMFNAFQMIVESLREFLSDVKGISNRVSTFSDELAVLSGKSSKDVDDMAQNSTNMAEINDGQVKNISKLIISMEDLHHDISKFTHDINIGEDETRSNHINSIAKEMEKIIKEFKQTQNIEKFGSEQTKYIFTLIEKQSYVMEEIASASQCLAELGTELNLYISKFKY